MEIFESSIELSVLRIILPKVFLDIQTVAVSQSFHQELLTKRLQQLYLI